MTWSSYKFSDHPVHVYGLLNEPGEKTTIVFLFGSEPGPHQWVTYMIDLRPVFGTSFHAKGGWGAGNGPVKALGCSVLKAIIQITSVFFLC